MLCRGSTDGKVKDRSGTQLDGIIEIMCRYSKHEEEACKDSTFYCELEDSKICLKSSHVYHQAQLQFYVGSNLYSWCDICIFTTKGLELHTFFQMRNGRKKRYQS